MQDESEDTRLYYVVINDEEQYSIWAAEREVPAGWRTVGDSRPKAEYKGVEADPIMIDFWLTGAKLKGDGGEYRVRYIVDDDEPKFIDKWEPIWLSGWISGKHTVRLELLDKNSNPVDNGGYNTTSREITVVK